VKNLILTGARPKTTHLKVVLFFGCFTHCFTHALLIAFGRAFGRV
jgi:hypothetical protein